MDNKSNKRTKTNKTNKTNKKRSKMNKKCSRIKKSSHYNNRKKTGGGKLPKPTAQVYKANPSTNSKPIKVPELIIELNGEEDKIHIYLNFLIDLMGSSLYDAFINNVNTTYGLNIELKPVKNVQAETESYIKKFDKPCIFYKSDSDYTHFVCTYKSSFGDCQTKINPVTTETRNNSSRVARNACKLNKICLWDPYYNVGGSDCTIYGGIQKQNAHSFCQTFTLGCILNQYLAPNELTQQFKNMKSINNIDNMATKNKILVQNAFYAKSIACQVVKYVFDNNITHVNSAGTVIDFYDILYCLLYPRKCNINNDSNYVIAPGVTEDNYKEFCRAFLYYCDNITLQQITDSTFIDNIIYRV
jgi:hypothetical protein